MAARRGKFGRMPRVQPSIGGTLVSIAREQVARQDANITDAWKNGGEFEGKKVTDELVLKYWQKRMANLDHKDPLYDTYKDQVLQLQYGIEQSKADLAHVQGKMSDGEFANFYLKWAKKAPRNSEWWRSLQKDAAQLMASAKEKARVNGERQKQERFNNFVSDTTKNDIAVGNALTEAIAGLSKETGLNLTDNGERLLSLLTDDYAKHPDKYHALADAIKQGGDTSFSGTFTTAFVTREIDSAESGYDKIATRANKDGYASAYATATKGQADLAGWGSNLDVWPVAKAYDKAYAAMTKVLDDPNASAMDKKAAANAFGVTAGNLAKTPGIDTASVTMLQADAARALGEDAGDSPSFGTGMLGGRGFTADMSSAVAYTTAAEDAMLQNPGAFVYAPTDKNGNFDPTGTGAVGIVPSGTVPSNAVFVAIPGNNGTARMVAMQPKDILVNDPNNPDAKPTAIGKTIQYQVGGAAVTLYGYADSTGAAHWSLSSPLATGTTAAFDKDGNMRVDLPGAADPSAKAGQIDSQYHTDIAAQIANLPPGGKATASTFQRGEDGKVNSKITVEYDGSQFKVKQTNIGYETGPDGVARQIEGDTFEAPIAVTTPEALQQSATAPDRWSGGELFGITFDSPVAASVAETANKMSSGQVAALAQDPAFQHAFLNQTMQTLGTNNPADPRVIAAWNHATKIATSTEVNIPGGMNQPLLGKGALDRADLKYPGMEPTQDPTKTQATISFGGQDIKVPGLPAYLNGPQGQAPAWDLNGITDLLSGGKAFAQTNLQPGQQPGMPAGTTPTITPTTGFTVTPTAPKSTATPATTTAPPGALAPPSSGGIVNTGIPKPPPGPAGGYGGGTQKK